MKRFYGKYRGTVASNLDPMQLGRLQVSVPAVLGTGRLSWAMPCVPFAGPKMGFFALPPINTSLWVEFEDGDPDYPIWTGCFWTTAQVPAEPAIEGMNVLKSRFATFTLNDLPGIMGAKLEALIPTLPMPMTLEFGATGIEISMGLGSFKIDAESVALAFGTANIKIAQEGIEINNPPSKIEVTPANISIQSGAAAVDLNGVSVTVNKGALEVI